jgi:hypothetical protein
MIARALSTVFVVAMLVGLGSAMTVRHMAKAGDVADPAPVAAVVPALPVLPETSLDEFDKTGVMEGDDYFSQIRYLLNGTAKVPPIPGGPFDQQQAAKMETVLLEVAARVQAHQKAMAGTKKVQSFCEICILVMQMKERGQPHLCAGLNENYYITCVEVLISLLRADKALVYWLKNGCMHMDTAGPEIVRPCPAMNICSWVPNLFSQPPSIVRDGVESLCPKDNKYLPTIPEEYKDLLGQGDARP